MNSDGLISGIHIQVYRAAIDATLTQLAKPVGIRQDRVELSAWFNRLTAEDKAQVADVVRTAAYGAVFNMLAALDGVKVIDDAHTELYLRTGSGELLNEEHDLHELFQIAVDHELGYVDEFGNPRILPATDDPVLLGVGTIATINAVGARVHSRLPVPREGDL